MRKQTVIFIQAMMVMAIVSGCRSNPTAMATNENGVMQEEQEIITDAGSDNALEEVPERLVCSYESLNGIKNLDIPIERTDQKLLYGKVQRKKKSPEIICNVLEPESLWSQDKELAQETKADDVYQTEITTALGQNISRQLFVFDEGTYFYSNTIGDETMFSVDSDLISEEMWTEEEQKFVQSRIDDAEEIFKNLGVDYRVTQTQLYKNGNNYFVTVGLSEYMDGVPVCDFYGISAGSDMLLATGLITLSEDRISEFRVCGTSEIMSDAEQCKLLSWQQIENCFQEEIKGADWGNYDITAVKLEYLVKNDLTFVPVWSFYGEIAENIEKPLLCLNASSGKVEFQWGM